MTGVLNANDVETTILSWGVAKWLVSQKTHGSTLSCGEVVVLPGKSHEWHVHDESDEIVYVLSGHGLFGVGDDLRMPIRLLHFGCFPKISQNFLAVLPLAMFSTDETYESTEVSCLEKIPPPRPS